MLSTNSSSPSVRGEKRKSKKGSSKRGHGVLRGLFSLSASILPFSLCLVSSLPFFAKGMQGAKDCGVECMVEVYCSKGEEGKCETGF